MLNLIIMKKILQLLILIAVLIACQNSVKVDSKQTDSVGKENVKPESENIKSQSDKSELNERAKINLTEFLDNSKIPVEEIEISKDTVINEYIKTLIDSDSVQILEYSKIKYEEMPEIIDERCVYIDYRINTDLKKRMSNFFNQLETEIRKGKVFSNEYPVDSSAVENTFNKLNDIYFTASSLKNQIVLFEYDMFYPTIISDTSILFKDMEGWIDSKFNRIEKENGNFNFFVYGYRNSIQKYGIKLLDTEDDVQIWNLSDKYYFLKIPLDKAMALPVLHILNTGGLDDVYENFDELNLKEIYNN